MQVLGSILGRFGIDLGTFWHVGRIAKIAKNIFFIGFSLFWVVRVACSGVLGVILGDVGSKIAFWSTFWGDVATCWRQDGDQERQDEPT